MLVRAGVGVAMGTASDYVKERADWTTASVDDEGIVRPWSILACCKKESERFTNSYRIYVGFCVECN